MNLQLKNALQIRYIKLHFTVALMEDTELPMDKVSALRGGMGEMLLRANCVRNRDCENCDFESECIVRRTMYSKYKVVPQFVTTNDSIGYILECEDYNKAFCEGDLFQFHLILFGKTIVYFNQYMQAFFALGQEGIGKNHSKYQIVAVTNTQNQPLFEDGAIYMHNYRIQTVEEYVNDRIRCLKRHNRQNRIVFHTPVTIKYQGQFLETYNMDAIWNAVLRRIYMLDCFEELEHTIYDMEEMKEFVLPELVKQKVYPVNVKRYSSTQDRKMVLKGNKGYIQLESIPDHILPQLFAGELLHIGKNISFGFGRYQVV